MNKKDERILQIMRDHFIFGYNSVHKMYGCQFVALTEEDAKTLYDYFKLGRLMIPANAKIVKIKKGNIKNE